MSEFYFSKAYIEARQRFKEAAAAIGATISSHRIGSQSQDELTIDVAIIGPGGAPAIVTSSSVYGIEVFWFSRTARTS